MTTIDTERTEKKVRDRAYRIWEEEGRPEGRAVQHWQRALKEVFATPVATAPAAAKAPAATATKTVAEPAAKTVEPERKAATTKTRGAKQSA